jgi:hypothetical protein
VQISSTNALKPLPAVVPPSAFLPFPYKTVEKGALRSGFTVIAFAEPSAAQDFCGNEISMADNWL